MVSVETTLAGALMLSLALAQSTTTTNTRPSDVQTLYGLCGGLAAFPTPFTRTLCEDGATCNRPNSFYWQCVPAPRTTPPTTATSEYAPKTTTTPAVTTTTSRLQSRFGQCGGIAWPGPQACSSGLTCSTANAYFAQCL
ncbi:hypothetical protein TWF102_003959 [Orbilia oligospora]|uniref:CBM1 domain-containing protein n=1 Tax=Orbilia oligospora TaxID=2813651 RepID=A0A7C8NRN3_ORBOL|nr:hypothetical protein TWF103_009589 [Orbilia oligospora]KAF3103143.1 hypothetical protein TWF102_003959 [Orbilia oligospora]